MSEIKPVYQAVKNFYGTWEDVSKEFAETVRCPTRILYPAAAYEYMKNCADELLAENKALKEKLERLNGLYHAEVSKHQLDYNALKAENEAQAKKIAELEQHVTKLGSGSRQHLYQAFARRYKEILSLRRENETQRKLIEALETLCTHDYESKDDFILRVKEKLKNGDSK